MFSRETNLLPRPHTQRMRPIASFLLTAAFKRYYVYVIITYQASPGEQHEV